VARLGYDGKGQARVASARSARRLPNSAVCPACWKSALQVKTEISVVVARTREASVAVFPVTENEHRGILDQRGAGAGR
jgi:5-(carboxyamino)imidazole ribonucleotide synthase